MLSCNNDNTVPIKKIEISFFKEWESIQNNEPNMKNFQSHFYIIDSEMILLNYIKSKEGFSLISMIIRFIEGTQGGDKPPFVPSIPDSIILSNTDYYEIDTNSTLYKKQYLEYLRNGAFDNIAYLLDNGNNYLSFYSINFNQEIKFVKIQKSPLIDNLILNIPDSLKDYNTDYVSRRVGFYTTISYWDRFRSKIFFMNRLSEMIDCNNENLLSNQSKINTNLKKQVKPSPFLREVYCLFKSNIN